MPQQFPTTAVPTRYQWCVDAGIARHGVHPNDPDKCHLNHALVCPNRPHQDELPELTPELARIRTALGVAHRKLIDAGLHPAVLPEPATHSRSDHHDVLDPAEDVRHILAHGDTWLRLAPGRIEHLQCIATDHHTGGRCINPVYHPHDGTWQPAPIPTHGSRTVQTALAAHSGTMWVWSLHPHTETALLRWYRQRCPDHATPTSSDAVPSELTPYDPVRHSHYILGERPTGYDTPTTSTGVHDDGRQRCAGEGCTNGRAGRHEKGWLCWTCLPKAKRRQRTTNSRWRARVAELTAHPTPDTPQPAQHHGGVDTVLSAIPAPVIRALGGTLPPDLVTLTREELNVRTPTELIDRIERRWGTRWANARLRRHPRDTRPDSIPPHDIAHRLLAPTDCQARCEDGWSRDLHTPCPTCRAQRRATTAEQRARQEEFAAETGPTPQPPTDRTTTEAINHRPAGLTECDGRDGGCGLPVRPPHTRCPTCRGWTLCHCGTHHDPHQDCPTCAAF